MGNQGKEEEREQSLFSGRDVGGAPAGVVEFKAHVFSLAWGVTPDGPEGLGNNESLEWNLPYPTPEATGGWGVEVRR